VARIFAFSVSILNRSALRDDMPWTYSSVSPVSATYAFALCKNVGFPCPFGSSNSMLIDHVSSPSTCITSYGTANDAKARLIPVPAAQSPGQSGDASASLGAPSGDYGIAITYTDPLSPCYASSGKSSYSIFNVYCDPLASPQDVSIIQSPDCGLVYTLRTRLACPTVSGSSGNPSSSSGGRRLGAGWIVLIVVVIGLVCYVVGGVSYNRIKYGARGIEAIPHVAIWRSLCARLQCSRQGSDSTSSTSNYSSLVGDDFYKTEEGARPIVSERLL